jgi:hypothetical protein
LIDSPKLIQFNKSESLNPDGKSYGEFSNLKELLDNIKMNDNPVIVVSHIKNN